MHTEGWIRAKVLFPKLPLSADYAYTAKKQEQQKKQYLAVSWVFSIKNFFDNRRSMKKMQIPTNYKKHTSSDPSRKFFMNRFYKLLIRVLKPLPIQSVLDAGCGEGFTLEKLEENNIGKILEGIDNAKEAILIGKKQFPRLTLKIGSIYDLPCNDNSFDLVICSEVLEHLDNPQKALQEIIRVSKKYLLLSVPNEPFYRGSRFLRGVEMKKFGDHPEHINHWTAFSFPKFVASEELLIKKKHFPFPWILLLAEK